MIYRNFKITFLTIILFACSTRLNLSLPPPQTIGEKKNEQINNLLQIERQGFITDYQLVKEKKINCKQLSIKNYKDFALNDVINLYLEIYCGKMTKNHPKWLDKLKLKLILSKNEYVVNDDYINATIDYLKFLKTQKQRVSRLKKLLSRVKGNPVWTQKLTKKLFSIAPRLDISARKNKSAYYKIARDFERNRKFKTARKFYRKILYNPRETISTRIKAWQRTLRTYKNERNKKTYLFTIYKFRKWLHSVKSRKRTDRWILGITNQTWTIKLARALWNQNKANQAKYLLQMKLKKKYFSGSNIAKVNWLIAQIWLEKKQLNNALLNLKIAQSINHNDIKLKELILWSYSFTLILSSKYREASRLLEQNIEKLEKNSPQPKLRFWLAYCYKQLSNPKYEIVLKELGEKHPYQYYGIISKYLLGSTFQKLSIQTPAFPKNDLTYSWLYYFKEKDLLDEYKKFKIKKLGKSKEENSLKKYFSYMYYSKDFNKAIFKYYSMKYEKRDQLKNIALSFLFPTPFKNEISGIAKRYNVFAPLVYSITRQESAFNPHARSSADAFGLMQLIPRRAKELSKKLKISYKSQNDLYDPQINITLGTFLLKQTLKKYNYNFVKTVASYNAGNRAIKGWFKNRFEGDYFKFIELIPYRETRKYVKLTFRNFIIYKQLLSTRPFIIKDHFFENINDSYEYLAVSKN